MWSENGRRPFSSSVGCWSDKEIWGSVVFKNRTHTGMKELQPFYPSGGRVKDEHRKQSTKEPSVKDTLRNSNKLGRTWKNNEWLRQTILAVCLSQIIWVGKCNASDVKMCNAAIVFTQSPLYLLLFRLLYSRKQHLPVAFCIYGDKSVSVCFVTKHKKCCWWLYTQTAASIKIYTTLQSKILMVTVACISNNQDVMRNTAVSTILP